MVIPDINVVTSILDLRRHASKTVGIALISYFVVSMSELIIHILNLKPDINKLPAGLGCGHLVFFGISPHLLWLVH